MEKSKEYLRIKKIVIIEELAKMISENKDCLDVDLSCLAKNQMLVDEIGLLLDSKKLDEEIVRELHNLFKKYKAEA